MIELIALVVIFSTIQSIFGLGLLLFGTPTLLLLEYSYSETLWLLLPCSVTISLIQSVRDYKLIKAKKRAVYIIIPTLILSLSLVIIYESDVNIIKIVGVLLLLIGVIRLSSKLQALLGSMSIKYIQIYYIMIGVVHGATNMGGGPLSILMSTIHSKKEIIRANVAFIYLILVIFQLVVLSIISNTSVKSEVMLLIPISLVTYIFTSKIISPKINNENYTFVLNVMVLVCGVLAIIK